MLLSMQGIDKSFSGVQALTVGVARIEAGEVMALVGQNGAGKSTMIKILTGAYSRDAGEIVFDGKPVDFRSTADSQAAGIATIYQEINLVPHRSVAENIFLGREPRRFGLLDRRSMRAEARAGAASASTSTSTSAGRSRTSAPRPGRWSRSPAPSPRTRGSSSWTSRPPRSTSARSRSCSTSSAR